ncbi:unnamed protein product [Cylicocyclus nassatus]|uniref:Uncharacterized protein n=1 Tax=Cylicocyclus nassatus TaxID=53992 RepID=A0AA36H4K3_CYLNA|nr:unnamed protein product [Cylicocyclus nassatus]
MRRLKIVLLHLVRRSCKLEVKPNTKLSVGLEQKYHKRYGMAEETKISFVSIPLMGKPERFSSDCANRAREMCRLVQQKGASIPLSDRFYFLSKGYMLLVSRPKQVDRKVLPVTVIAYSPPRAEWANFNARYKPQASIDVNAYRNWRKFGG